MRIDGDSWFSLAAKKMDWAAGRQKVIASNIANADTPSFKPRDVVSFEEHLSRSSSAERGYPDTVQHESLWGGSMDGNGVVLEEQMELSNSAASEYQLASTLYRKGYDMLNIAIS